MEVVGAHNLSESPANWEKQPPTRADFLLRRKWTPDGNWLCFYWWNLRLFQSGLRTWSTWGFCKRMQSSANTSTEYSSSHQHVCTEVDQLLLVNLISPRCEWKWKQVSARWYWLSMRQRQMVLFTRGEDCCCRSWWSGNTGFLQITAAGCCGLVLYCHHNNNTQLKVHFSMWDVATPHVAISAGLGSSHRFKCFNFSLQISLKGRGNSNMPNEHTLASELGFRGGWTDETSGLSDCCSSTWATLSCDSEAVVLSQRPLIRGVQAFHQAL